MIRNIEIYKNPSVYSTIKPGKIMYIRYILIKNDEIKISNFIGLCTSIKKKSNTIMLKNTIKKEDVRLLIYLHSPLILSIKVLKKYKKKYRLSKLYFK